MTITIRLPDETEAKLKARLEKGDVALSEFVRQAITEKLEREPKVGHPTPYEVLQQNFEGYASGETDRSERAEDILRTELKARYDAKHRDR